jgi:sugar transferase (PEP-CTERM system associated)
METLKRKILVLGVGNRAARIDRLEREDQGAGFIVAGFVPLSDQAPIIDESRNIWGNLRLSDLAREQGVEEIIVALDERRGALPVDALLDCKLAGIEVLDFATFWERETGRVDLDSLTPSWLIFSDGFVGGWLQAIAKRVFDVATSLLLLIFSLPLLAITAIIVRLESPGPVLYRQERVGLNNKPFMLLKFRSMREDAEKDGNPQWAAENDSRVTRVGAFMRKSRIDELPQIINVLKGEMSFIGPRPERPYFVEKLSEIIPYYGERHRVKPGISGWAQLNFPYGASDEDAKQKFQYDLYYIKNYSLFLDLIVLVQTVRVVLWPVGAR